MSSANPLADLRARLVAHGYHVFLRPDRPSGWWVTIRDGGDALRGADRGAAPRPGTRPLLLADRLFTNHRLAELDQADPRQRPARRRRGTSPTRRRALETLAAFARTLAIA